MYFVLFIFISIFALHHSKRGANNTIFENSVGESLPTAPSHSLAANFPKLININWITKKTHQVLINQIILLTDERKELGKCNHE